MRPKEVTTLRNAIWDYTDGAAMSAAAVVSEMIRQGWREDEVQGALQRMIDSGDLSVRDYHAAP